MATAEQRLREDIAQALGAMSSGDLATTAPAFFELLGYETSRRFPDAADTEPQTFIRNHPARHPDTKTEGEFLEQVTSVKLLFQVSDTEIRRAAGMQDDMFAAKFGEDADKSIVTSFVFAVADLKRDSYPRGGYARVAREVNKRLPVATVVLMRNPSGNITLAFVDRREHKRRAGRPVLGNVALLREIDTENPHRAHLDILSELTVANRLGWIDREPGKTNDFAGLLAAWLKVLDTEALNERFYEGLFEWYQRAIDECGFPTEHGPQEEHVIRLITRLMFIWFIKEKGFVARELFEEQQVAHMLKDWDCEKGDSYYRCVLQNLFFGTLNTPVPVRGFEDWQPKGGAPYQSLSEHSLMFRDEIAQHDALLDSFHVSPFINGGLFDCLDEYDDFGDVSKVVDGFIESRGHSSRVSVPNSLFFGESGIVTLFDRFKFTVEESTPVEREVALDPELLGNVFESLLAKVHPDPDRRETQRSMTGSFYTPKGVVDYMVDEALTASVMARLSAESQFGNVTRENLLDLLDYGVVEHPFEETEAEALVGAIADTKVIDPAVGSGAFPMSALHKLTLALRKLDPDNKLWREYQQREAVKRAEQAFGIDAREVRDAVLDEISAVFETYGGSDYGRKLYLIQNCIFGVDIQAIAVQISKLRFFISLAIEQSLDHSAENYGIKALPNLETRFVIADTLLPLGRSSQQSLADTPLMQERKERLMSIRERYFRTPDPDVKARLRDEDESLRREIASILEAVGMPKSDADRLVEWSPYGQNSVATWFDPKYMFNVSGGFDVIIGNPPYVNMNKRSDLKRKYGTLGYRTYRAKGDLYQLFVERGMMCVSETGYLSYIVSNSWMNTDAGANTRRLLCDRYSVSRLIMTGTDVFETSDVDTCIILIGALPTLEVCATYDARDVNKAQFRIPEEGWSRFHPRLSDVWYVMTEQEESVAGKMRAKGDPLRDWNVQMFNGVKTGANDVYLVDTEKRQSILEEEPHAENVFKRLVRGGDLKAYSAKWKDVWLIDIPKSFPLDAVEDRGPSDITPEEAFRDLYPRLHHYMVSRRDRLERRRMSATDEWYVLQRSRPNYRRHLDQPRLVWSDISDPPTFVEVDGSLLGNDKTFTLVGGSVGLLCGVLNSTLIRWWVGHNATTTPDGRLQWKIRTVGAIPIPKPAREFEQSMGELVDNAHLARRCNPDADIAGLGRRIDQLVYELYGLTDEEIAVVQASVARQLKWRRTRRPRSRRK